MLLQKQVEMKMKIGYPLRTLGEVVNLEAEL
jgi:hypothetical protein